MLRVPVRLLASVSVVSIACTGLAALTGTAASAAPVGTISTIVGNGSSGSTGDGGPATAATMAAPAGVAYDLAGNLYVSDSVDSVVRKVTPSGTITSIAGTAGSAGFSGDGGPATSATLAVPTGLALDRAGNLYIADFSNNRIRKVSSAGTISTFAGNGTAGDAGDGSSALSAQLDQPWSVTIDGQGRFLIPENSGRIRRVDTDGTISTIAGTTGGFSGDGGPATAAQLNAPSSVVLDANQNIVIADTDNERIRRIDAHTGIITTIAGTGPQTSTGDGGPAAAATLDGPLFLARDGGGNLFFTELFGNRVRRIDARTGIITTVAGTGTAGYNGDAQSATAAQLQMPFGIAIDATSDVVVADSGNHRVRSIVGIATPPPQGYYLAAADGGVFTHGSVVFRGSEGGAKLVKPVVGVAVTPSHGGYWLFASDGGVFTHGDAAFFGSEGARKLAQPVVAGVSTPSGNGYWLFAADGGVFTHGDAKFFGSEGGRRLAQPVVAAAATPSGNGYWLFAADGGVFTHGDAAFYGSEGALKLALPVVSGASAPDGRGYWLFASDGGVFTHGDAGFFGSEGALKLAKPIVASAATSTGRGYWLFASDGGVFTHGDAGFFGSEGALKLAQPVVAGAAS
ncbi:MAG: repeat containing protein [Actinomycetia bacterium]|nr:repeat containing protein [Actinomycetes bacterium]